MRIITTYFDDCNRVYNRTEHKIAGDMKTFTRKLENAILTITGVSEDECESIDLEVKRYRGKVSKNFIFYPDIDNRSAFLQEIKNWIIKTNK